MKDSMIKYLESLEAEEAGSILVRNEGFYVARFSVAYTLNGDRFTEYSGEFPILQNRSIRIPAGATEIYLKVEKAVFINVWSTIFDENFPEPVKKCYKVWGTIFADGHDEIPC